MIANVLDTIDAGADLLDDHHWVDWAIAALLPTPQVSSFDSDPDATLHRARTEWLSPEGITDLIDRGQSLARGRPKAADALVQFAKCAPLPWQHTTGLHWLEHIIDGHYDTFARQCWHLTDWLAALRENGIDTQMAPHAGSAL